MARESGQGTACTAASCSASVQGKVHLITQDAGGVKLMAEKPDGLADAAVVFASTTSAAAVVSVSTTSATAVVSASTTSADAVISASTTSAATVVSASTASAQEKVPLVAQDAGGVKLILEKLDGLADAAAVSASTTTASADAYTSSASLSTSSSSASLSTYTGSGDVSTCTGSGGVSSFSSSDLKEIGDDDEGRKVISAIYGDPTLPGTSSAATDHERWARGAEEVVRVITERIDELCVDALGVKDALFYGQRVDGKVAHREASLADMRRSIGVSHRSVFGMVDVSGRRFSAAAVTEIAHSSGTAPWPRMTSSVMKKKGPCIEPVSWNAMFYVPMAGLTGNLALDEMNWILADAYSSITHLLVRIETKLLLTCYVEGCGDDDVGDLKSAISKLRTMCYKIRREITNLGGRPLCEPVKIWKEKFGFKF